jgi:hypothetical protein
MIFRIYSNSSLELRLDILDISRTNTRNFSECLRRKDEVIKQALLEKQLLVADILNIPKEDFEHVADIASEPSALDKEPAELILAAINQSI